MKWGNEVAGWNVFRTHEGWGGGGVGVTGGESDSGRLKASLT